MTRLDLSKLSLDDLLERYVELSIRQGEALESGTISQVNRLGEQIYKISKELKARPGDRRDAFLKLFSHPNAQVRFNAATSSIAIVPLEARQTIQAIADSGIFPLAGHAGMYLSTYDGEASRLFRKPSS